MSEEVLRGEIDSITELKHYGILRRSGRYPWGSGDNVADRSKGFLDWFRSMLDRGLTEQEAAAGVGMTTAQIREARTIALAEKKAADVTLAHRLKEKGYSNSAIGRRMGIPESSVRNLLKPGADDKAKIISTTVEVLRDNVEKKGYVDVGKGVEAQLGIASTKLSTALAILKDEGYQVHTLKVDQAGTDKKTIYKVLVKEGTTQKDAWLNRDKISQWGIDNFSDDGGRTAFGIQPPLSIDPARIAVKYAEEGGTEADGVMYIRPGVSDISIGANQYAQVRVKVGDGHYIKGMAIYKDDLPDGVDIMFNTNKSNTGNKLDALKKLSDDPDNPFGSVIKRQIVEIDPKTGKERVTSAMNILYEEGDWDDWSRTLSSQMLSKQDPKLAKQQLDLLHERKQADLDEITALTNPVVKRVLLNQFADSADSAAVHLKAAGMDRQSTHVILPVPKMKETEIYAPNFNDGERVVLIRHPHGGVFEIPELVVNNRHPTAKKLLGRAKDAVGINAKVAEKLSGADFDGDTVLVIPNNKGQIRTAPTLEGLKNFDPKAAYPKYEGMKVMSDTQTQMGKISNLITDMSIKGASQEELARAVRHSMVVIDAEKHQLNYKQSAKDNGIAELKRKYQTNPETGGTGAATIVSRAKSPVYLPDFRERKASEGGPIDPKTGKKIYVETGAVDKRTGKPKTKRTERLSVTDDAFELSSGTPIESIYASHSNRMKAMANSARKEMLATADIPYSPSAKKAYAAEVASLTAKYNTALKNKPRERQAQVIADTTIRAKKRDNPSMSPDELKKVKSQALKAARARVGAQKSRINIEPKEWEAIQAGAISTNRLKEIVANSDLDDLKQLATPRTQTLMTSTKLNRARSMASSGYTQAEIAKALGVSLTTLKDGLRGE